MDGQLEFYDTNHVSLMNAVEHSSATDLEWDLTGAQPASGTNRQSGCLKSLIETALDFTSLMLICPACACAARGKVISHGVLVVSIKKKSTLFFGTKILSLKILTFRSLF